jgi:hypothetical protein
MIITLLSRTSWGGGWVGVLLCGSHDCMMSLVSSKQTFFIIIIITTTGEIECEKSGIKIVEIKVIVVETFFDCQKFEFKKKRDSPNFYSWGHHVGSQMFFEKDV